MYRRLSSLRLYTGRNEYYEHSARFNKHRRLDSLRYIGRHLPTVFKLRLAQQNRIMSPWSFTTFLERSNTMSSPDADRFIRNWNRVHMDTSRVLRAAPDDTLDWRPKEDMFTMRELIGHIPQAEAVLVRSALAGSTQKVPFDTSRGSEEIAAAFDKQHEELAQEVSALTAEQWREEVEFHGNKLR